MKVSLQEVNEIIRCPNCLKTIELKKSEDSQCYSCGEYYMKLPFSWDLIPSSFNSMDLGDIWKQLQANGMISYIEDPINNLSVGDRSDCHEFAQFCSFDGLVLDVGCGPQPWPSYFSHYSERTRFIGIDPLVGESAADYFQIRSAGEFLLFKDEAFDHVVFATSLDHVIDPVKSLSEARRISKQDGHINIWIGEKTPNAPKPETSNEWYKKLKRPENAEDVFHLKRLKLLDLAFMLDMADLEIIDKKSNAIDEYKTIYFLKTKRKPKIKGKI
jgi:SAM-dependent methyltransferase